MEIVVTRKENDGEACTGTVTIDGQHFAYTLEDKDRGLTDKMPLEEIKRVKVWGKTAIPTGRYQVYKHFWNKHKRFAPGLALVPGYEGVLVHSGVTDKDSLGCILIGLKVFRDALENSRSARILFDKKVFDALDKGESVFITVVREYKV